MITRIDLIVIIVIIIILSILSILIIISSISIAFVVFFLIYFFVSELFPVPSVAMPKCRHKPLTLPKPTRFITQ